MRRLQRAEVRTWATLAVLVLLYMASMLDRTIISMLVGPIRKSLSLNDFQVSLLMGTAFGVCYILFAVPFGWASDRFPRRYVVAVGIAFWSLACAGGGIATTFAGLLTSRALVGAGEASLSPIAYSLIADRFPRRRIPLAMAIYHYGGSVGGALALLVGGIIAEWTMGFDTILLPIVGRIPGYGVAFLAVGLPGVLLALLALTLPEPRQEQPRTVDAPKAAFWTFLQDNRGLVLAHFACFAAVLLVVYGVSFWIPELLIREQGWGPAETGRWLSVLNLTAVLTGQLFAVAVIGWFDRLERDDAVLRALGIVLCIAAAASVLAFASTSSHLLLAGNFILTACVHPVMTYGATSLQLFTPVELRGRLAGLFLGATSLIGLGAGPALIGLVSDARLTEQNPLHTALLVCSIGCLAIALGCLLAALPRYRRALRRVRLGAVSPAGAA